VIRVGPPLATVGGLGLAAVAAVPAVVHGYRLVTAGDTATALFGGGVPLVVAVAVAAYGISLARRDTDGELTRAAISGVVAGTLLAGLVFLWTTRGGVVEYTTMAPLPVVASHVLTAGLAVGAMLGLSAERSRRTEKLAAGLFASLPNPAARVQREPDGERRVVDVNDAFLETFGPDRPHIGSPLSACLRPASGQDDVADVIEEEVAARSHLACGVAGGGDGVREFLVSRAEVGNDEEFVVLLDVTDQQRRERRLAVLNRVLRHDLRTAVNVIDGRAADLARRAADGEASLEAIRDKTSGLLRLSRRARQLERLVGDEMPETTTDIVALAHDRLDEFDADHPRVTVERTLPSESVVVRDEGLLGAALDEVLDNVATHAGPDVTAAVSLTREGEMATLTVADDGPGIPETEQAVVDRTVESDLDHASGLGLWFVTWVVVELDGEVTVDGDDGTTVRLHVPLAESTEETETTDDERATTNGGGGRAVAAESEG
jgi:signal transduction histidine kinase